MAKDSKNKALTKSRSKFSIEDKGDPRHIRQNFVPKRAEGLYDKKEPTHKQFFDDIKHLGNIRGYYKGRKIFERGM